MKTWLCIILICAGRIDCSGQHIFLSTTARKQVVDSLRKKLIELNHEAAGFQRDTSLFFSLDRYYYHLSQLNSRFSPTVDLQKFYADSMFRIAQRRAWPQGLAIATVRQGRAAFNRRQDSTAFQLLQRSAAVCTQQKLSHELGLVLINLATCLVYRPTNTSEEWQRAMTYMHKALTVGQQTHDPEVIYLYYDFMGDFLILRGQYEQALHYFNAASPLIGRYPSMSGNRTNLGYLAICHLQLGHKQLAQHLLTRFFARSNPNEGTYANYLHHIVLYEISQYYLKKQAYPQALHYLRQYVRILHQRPPIDQFNYHRSLAEIYERTGKYQLALHHQRYYQAARDTIRSEEFSQHFAVMENRYQLTRKENQIQALKNQTLKHQNDVQQTRLWLLGVVLVFILGLAGLFLYTDRLRRKKIESELQMITIRNEVNARILHAQEYERQRMAADLHDDLGGVIATIRHQLDQGLATSSLPALRPLLESMITTTAQAGDKIRSIAHNLMPPDFERLGLVNSIQQLVNSLNDTRFRFAVFGKPHRLMPEVELNAYRILSELVHNAQKHAQAQHITIQLLFHADSLSLVVDDDGIGHLTTEKGNTSTGIGLKNLSSRVNYLNARWHVDTSPQGTINLIEIPYAFSPERHSDRG